MKEANFGQAYMKFSEHNCGLIVTSRAQRESETPNFNFGNMIHREAMIYDEHFTYGHYKVNTGTATVAGFRIGDKLYFGISLCSPNDNFSKSMGRVLAEDNIIFSENSSKRGVMVLDGKTKELHPTELLKLALEHHLNRMSHKPEWAKNHVVTFRPNSRKNNV